MTVEDARDSARALIESARLVNPEESSGGAEVAAPVRSR
jgi:hypothetical protein